MNRLAQELLNKKEKNGRADSKPNSIENRIKLSNMKDADMTQLSSVGWKKRPLLFSLDFSDSPRLTPVGIRVLMNSFRIEYLSDQEMKSDEILTIKRLGCKLWSSITTGKGETDFDKMDEVEAKMFAKTALDCASMFLVEHVLETNEFPSPNGDKICLSGANTDLPASALFVLGVKAEAFERTTKWFVGDVSYIEKKHPDLKSNIEERLIDLRRSPQVRKFVEHLSDKKVGDLNDPSNVEIVSRRRNSIIEIQRCFEFVSMEQRSQLQSYVRKNIPYGKFVSFIEFIKQHKDNLTPRKVDLLGKKISTFCPIDTLMLRKCKLSNESLDVMIELLPTTSLMNLNLDDNTDLDPTKLQIISNLLEQNKIRFEEELNFFKEKITQKSNTPSTVSSSSLGRAKVNELSQGKPSSLKNESSLSLKDFKAEISPELTSSKKGIKIKSEEELSQDLEKHFQGFELLRHVLAVKREQFETNCLHRDLETQEFHKKQNSSLNAEWLIANMPGYISASPIYQCYFNAFMQDVSELMIAAFLEDNKNVTSLSMNGLPRLDAIFASFNRSFDFNDKTKRDIFLENIRNFLITRSAGEKLFTDTAYSSVLISISGLARDITITNAASIAREDVRKIITAIISGAAIERSPFSLSGFISQPICMDWQS